MCDVKSWWKCEDLQGEKIGAAKAGRLVYEKENAASQKLKVYAFKKENVAAQERFKRADKQKIRSNAFQR